MATRTITTRLAVDGETEFKRSLGNANSELKTLRSEMSLVDAEFKGQANSMDALTAKNKILRREQEQQAEKVKALERAVKDAADAYGENDKRTDGYRQQLNRAKKELIDMNDALDDNERYLDEARKSADKCASSIDGFGREVKDAGDKTSLFGTIVAANLTSGAIRDGVKRLADGLKALPVAVVRELAEGFRDAAAAVKEMADTAGDLDDAAKRTGTTAEEYQKWAYAAKLGGMEINTLEGLMVKQQKTFSDAREGVKASAEAYKRLGINIKDISSEQAFNLVIDALADMEDETTRNALANDIFGKSYANLAPLLAEGSEGIAKWKQEVVDLGGVMSNEAVEAGASFGDSLDRLQTRFDGLKNNLAGDFLPGFTDVVDGMTEVLGGNVDKGIDLISNGLDKAADVLEKLGPVADAALEKFLDVFIENFPDIVKTGGNLILKLVEGIGDKGPDIIRAAADAINTLVNKLTSPETLDTLGKAGLKIGSALIEGIFSIFSNIGSRMWDEIKAFFGGNPYANNSKTADIPQIVTNARTASSEYSVSPSQTINIKSTILLDGRQVGESVSQYQQRAQRAYQ